MNTTKVLIFTGITAGLAVLAAHVHAQGKKLSDFDYKLRSASIIDQTSEYLEVEVMMDIVNPTSIETKIKDIDVTIFIADIKAGSIVIPEEKLVPANGSFLLRFKGKIYKKNLEKNILTVLSTLLAKRDLPVDFVGNIKVYTGFFWVSKKIKVGTTGKDLVELYQEYYG